MTRRNEVVSEILIKGNYPEQNKVECPECKCYFQFYTQEIQVDMTTQDEMDLLGGFGVHKWIRCPQCNCVVTLQCQFTEDRPMQSLNEFFRNIFKKKKERNDKNGEN